LFDEHVVWGAAGQENIDRDGFFHFKMSAEFLNMRPRLAGELLEEAVDPVVPKRWRTDLVALPFRMDAVNSFEETVDPWLPEECPILGLPRDDAGMSWTDETAHTGSHSIRLRTAGVAERREVFPVGAVCRVCPHTRYRLTAWIRTEAVERFARVELGSYEYTFTNFIDLAGSENVCGTSDWTRVEVTLDSGDEAYLMPKMVLYGPGTAWFDDVCLEPAACAGAGVTGGGRCAPSG
jgi:hypothetical protein